ncbi:hypothetical protein FRB95_002254 [Tulasnella sp. JGI-2019a]|nr:hypothetical protein FRB95_002254 [Tulasnella sp. JGI-2019a]
MAMLVDRAALHNYILTGDKRRLDGGVTVDGLKFVETPSEETPPNQVERWRQQVDAAELPVIPSPTPATPPRTPPRKRSTGPYSPSPSTTLPANSRLELSVPRDIGAWVLSIPQGACPPDDAPWSSPVGGSEDGTEEAIEELLIAHAERKPGPDISTVALSSDGQALQPQGPKPLPNDVEVYKWRSENYVDWWRTGMAAEQQTRPVSVHMPAEGASSKPSLSDLGEVVTKRQMVAKRTLDGEPKLPLERGYSPVDSIPQPPTLIVKPPAQVAQVHATLSLPPPSLVQMSNPENLKRGSLTTLRLILMLRFPRLMH